MNYAYDRSTKRTVRNSGPYGPETRFPQEALARDAVLDSQDDVRDRRSCVCLCAIAFEEREARRGRMNPVRGKCASNIQNLGLAVLVYQHDKGVFPTGTWPNPNLEPLSRLSWYAPILNRLDCQDEYNALEKDRPWNVGQNDVIAHETRRDFSCPNDAGVAPGSPVPASYIGIAGVGTDAPLLPKSDMRAGVFGHDRKATLADITDGTANTMLIAETGRVSGSWLQGGVATVRGARSQEQALLWFGPPVRRIARPSAGWRWRMDRCAG